MTQRLRKYHPRAPRYVLLASENKVLRFKSKNDAPESNGTNIKNLSRTGLAFTYQGHNPPEIGETISIQFTVPQRDQMACRAKVVRKDDQLYAVRFLDLGPGARLNLMWGLQKSFDLLDEYRRYNWWRQQIVIIYHYADILALWIASLLIYFLSVYFY